MSDELAEILSRELQRHAPNMTSPEHAATVAAAVAIGAYAVRDGKLVPTSPQAVSQCGFLPRALVKAIAAEYAASAPTPAARTLAYVQALGAESWDAALGLNDSARLPADVAAALAADVASQHGPRTAQERTHARLFGDEK